MTDLELVLALLFAFLIVSTWRLAHRFTPWLYGASLTGILWEELDFEPAPVWTIAVRLVAPFTFGVAAALIRPGIGTAALVLMGSLAGLLICWPHFLEPERMPPALWPRRTAVLIVYAMFSVLCGVASLAGGRLGTYAIGRNLSELSAFGTSFLAGLVLAFLLWVARTAWTTKEAHRRMWDTRK